MSCEKNRLRKLADVYFPPQEPPNEEVYSNDSLELSSVLSFEESELDLPKDELTLQEEPLVDVVINPSECFSFHNDLDWPEEE